MEKYCELIEHLHEARIVFAELLIQIGTEHLKRNPLSNPAEFLELYLPSRHELLEILNEKRGNILFGYHNNGTKEMKMKTSRKSQRE